MPQIRFTDDQKRQLVGWLNGEKDLLVSLESIARRIVIPRVTGSLDLITDDLLFVRRVHQSISMYNRTGERVRGPSDSVELSNQDMETLVDIARSNRYEDREPFWRSIIETLEHRHDSNPAPIQ